MRLQTGQHRAEGGPQPLDPGDGQPIGVPMTRPARSRTGRATGWSRCLPGLAALHRRTSSAHTAAGDGQLYLRLQLQQVDDLPDHQDDDQRQDRRHDLLPSGATRARTRSGSSSTSRPAPTAAVSSRSTSRLGDHRSSVLAWRRSPLAVAGDLAATVRPRGSSIVRGPLMSTVHSPTTRPGREDSSTTRWPSRTASRTLWVTNTTVLPVSSRSGSARRAGRPG